jgi:hypothetical protein
MSSMEMMEASRSMREPEVPDVFAFLDLGAGSEPLSDVVGEMMMTLSREAGHFDEPRV